MGTRRIGRLEGWVWMMGGAAICFLAWKFRIGAFREPGPGFVALFSGLFLSGVGLVMVFSGTFSRISGRVVFGQVFRNISWYRLAYTMGLLLGYALFLNTLGYILTTLLVMWGLFLDWKKRSLVSSFLTSLLTTAVTYLVFEIWLHCQFPRGLLPWW